MYVGRCEIFIPRYGILYPGMKFGTHFYCIFSLVYNFLPRYEILYPGRQNLFENIFPGNKILHLGMKVYT
jgi:hypothetical protein